MLPITRIILVVCLSAALARSATEEKLKTRKTVPAVWALGQPDATDQLNQFGQFPRIHPIVIHSHDNDGSSSPWDSPHLQTADHLEQLPLPQGTLRGDPEAEDNDSEADADADAEDDKDPESNTLDLGALVIENEDYDDEVAAALNAQLDDEEVIGLPSKKKKKNSQSHSETEKERGGQKGKGKGKRKGQKKKKNKRGKGKGKGKGKGGGGQGWGWDHHHQHPNYQPWPMNHNYGHGHGGWTAGGLGGVGWRPNVFAQGFNRLINGISGVVYSNNHGWGSHGHHGGGHHGHGHGHHQHKPSYHHGLYTSNY